MTRIWQIVTVALAGSLLLAGTALADPDRFLGDASIYEGLPSDIGRPNILFIIDNSMATLRTVSSVEYNSATVYDVGMSSQGTSCEGVDNPAKECWQPWNVYKQDNQGDFATLVFENLNSAILGPDGNGICNPDGTNYIHTFFQSYGSYSGSGADPFPNLDVNGDCAYGVNNASGQVYALGNYLNFLKNASEVGVVDDADCPAPDVVVYSYMETYCTQPNKTVADCQANKLAERPRTGYYQTTETHIAETSTHPVTGTALEIPWNYIGTTLPAGLTATEWTSGTTYTWPTCNAGSGGGSLNATNKTQREVIYDTLENVVGSTATIVNFGAMVYGGNNSGADLLAGLDDLSSGLVSVPDGLFDVVVKPDCSASINTNLPYCIFFNGIPGPDRNADGDFNDPGSDGASTLSSNTLRPQAEALFDAGYYFGAGRSGEQDATTYTPIRNTTQINQQDSPCDLNHVILITNGFSNGDSSPNMDVIGDADGDDYENEEVYGLGSHWLDDVARYLRAEHGITTHTVLAFQAYDDLVANAAHDGEGQFHLASNGAQLRKALLDIIASIINEKSTSFVAPVVPASTTNRTISSNRVYLGLFKPQADGAWYGNVKKYGLTDDNRLAEPPQDPALVNGDAATYPDGTFDQDSISFWSLTADGLVPTAKGDIDPTTTEINAVKGDGGEVAAGGVGGRLLKRMDAVATEIANGTPFESTADQRDIFTYLPSGSTWVREDLVPSNSDITQSLLGLPDSSMSWYTTSIQAADATEAADQTVDEIRRRNLVRYLHGFDSLDVQAGESVFDVREWIMGDVLHSRPVVFNYTEYEADKEFTCYTGSESPGDFNSSVIFVGANDGMLHAFRDCDGEELWAFVPDDVLANLKYLPEIGHTSYVDSPPAILFYDQEEDGIVDEGEDLVLLVFGQRRGGGKNLLDTGSRGAYYVLDITDYDNPVLVNKFDTSAFGELAETWSLASIKPVKVPGSTDIRYVAFFTAGYDNNEDLRFGLNQAFPDGTDGTTDINGASTGGSVDGLDGNGNVSLQSSNGADADGYEMRGRAVAAVLLTQLRYQDVTFTEGGETTIEKRYKPLSPADVPAIGTVIWNSNDSLPDGYAYAKHPYSFAADVRTLDLNNNGGYIDRVYAGDTGGNLWRFDTTDRDPANWTAEIMFSANPGSGGSTDVGRKFFYSPSVAKVGSDVWVCFNTGDREHPLNLPVVDRLYCMRDFYGKYTADQISGISGFNGHITSDAVTEANLVDVTNNELQLGTTSGADVDAILNKLSSDPMHKVDPSTGAWDDNGTFYYGWYIKLNGTDRTLGGEYGEKALAEPVIFQDQVFFSTYQIKSDNSATCEAGNLGYSRLYRVNLKTGEAVYNYDLTNDTETTTNNTRAEGGEGEVLRRTDRVYSLGEGIPSGIVQVVDSAGNVSLLISSSDKVEGIEGSNPTMTFPLYWIQW